MYQIHPVYYVQLNASATKPITVLDPVDYIRVVDRHGSADCLPVPGVEVGVDEGGGDSGQTVCCQTSV